MTNYLPADIYAWEIQVSGLDSGKKWKKIFQLNSGTIL